MAATDRSSSGRSLAAARGWRDRTPIPILDRKRAWLPASFGQEGLWFLDRLAPDSTEYVLPLRARLRGPLDHAALTAALGAVVRRHEALRTHLAEEDGHPVQVVCDEIAVAIDVEDLSGLPDSVAAVDAALQDDARRPFDLTRGPLWRCRCYRLGPEDHLLSMSLHHAVFDGWSAGILLRDLAAFYREATGGAPAQLRPPAVQYADAAAWQRAALDGGRLDVTLSWWRARLDAAPRGLDLPADRPRPAMASRRGGQLGVVVTDDLVGHVDALARQAGVTRYMVLLASFQLLLGRIAGSTDVVVGSPVAGRSRAEFARVVGYFANMLAMRVDLGGGIDVVTLLARVREMALGAFAHQDLPFERLVRDLAPERDPGRHPIFQTMFSLQSLPLDPVRMGDVVVTPQPLALDMVKFDLSLTLHESDGRLEGELEYAADLFDAATADRILSQWQVLLAAMVADPGRRIDDLPLLDAAERRAVLRRWNDTARPRSEDALCLTDLVRQVAHDRPDWPAVVDDDGMLDYATLHRRAHRLAGLLVRCGVGPDQVVAVHLDRSTGLAVALLGTLMAGAAWLPLDPGYPAARLRDMLEDAGAGLVLSDRPLPFDLPPGVRCLDPAQMGEGGDEDEGVPLPRLHPDMLAYVIYTSGSTGRPKGVAVSHRAIVNRLCWMQEAYRLAPGARVLQKTPLSFDVSVWELFWPLISGGTLVMAAPGAHRDPVQLARIVAQQRIAVMHFVPAMLDAFLAAGPDPLPDASLRAIVCSGEALPARLAARAAAWSGAPVHNLYGPTEAAVDVTAWTADPGVTTGMVPIGRPIANLRVLVVDHRLEPVADGQEGELALAGIGLARGYLGRPGLTAERFRPDPTGCDDPAGQGDWTGQGGRIYLTGDRVRRDRDGVLHYLGRIDDQIKLRGFRIEPGEIEAALVAAGAVAAAVGVRGGGDAARARLVGHVVLSETGPEPRSMLATLAQRLPAHMVPAVLVPVDALPVTASGKLDRRALAARPLPEAATMVAGPAPEGATETAIAAIWAGLLGVPAIARDADLFAAGAHSLMAARAAARIAATLGRDLPLRALFDHPTIAGQAAALADAPEALRGGEAMAGDASRPSPMQERLWFLDQLDPGTRNYTIPLAARLRGRLDVTSMERALAAVVHRHGVLRTRYPARDGRPIPVTEPPQPVRLARRDLSPLPPERAWATAMDMARAEADRPFDLATGPIWRPVLIRIAPDDHLLVVTVHHIAFDGWSEGVLLRELATLYPAITAGRPQPDLPPVPDMAVQAARLHRRLADGRAGQLIDDWRRDLDGAPAALDLPLDHPRPADGGLAAARLAIDLPAALVARLNGLARDEGASLFMVLLAGLQVLLARWTGEPDVVVGTPVAGRRDPEAEDMIGLFVNMLPLRARLRPATTFRQAVAMARMATLDGFARQDLPFDRLVEALRPARDPSRHPIFQVMLALQNLPEVPVALPDLDITPVPVGGGTAMFDLSVTFTPHGDRLAGTIDYPAALFDATTIRSFARHLARVLDHAARAPDTMVSALDLLGAQERAAAIAAGRGAPAMPDGPRDLVSLFRRTAARMPDDIAVSGAGGPLTWRQLDMWSDAIASRIASLGAGPERVVGLAMERSAGLIAAVHAVLKTGAAVLPLDPDHPDGRLAHMVADAGAALVLADHQTVARMTAMTATLAMTVLDIADLPRTHLPDAGRFAAPAPHPDQAAFVIYTSGSTGRPKGVVGLHGAFANRFTWMYTAHPFAAGEAGAVKTAISFVDAIWELTGFTAGGCRAAVADRWTARDPAGLARFVAREGVTRMTVVPSLLKLLIETSSPALRADLAGVRVWVASGEALDGDLAARFRALFPQAILINLYGSSEVAADAAGTVVQAATPPRSIGRAIGGVTLHVLDDHGAPVPDGVPGEIHIGAAALARGYLGRPGLTAERFIPDPDRAGGRLFRTGDRGIRRADGHVDFLGRRDHQVKLHGFRIELGEIEAALMDLPGVTAAAARLVDDHQAGAMLAGYVEAAPDVSTGDLRAALADRLAPYMVPQVLMRLDRLPRTPSGKPDRLALPPPDAAMAGDDAADGGPPLGETETAIAAIWSELLHLPAIGRTADVFRLGAHSLLAARVAARLRERLAVDLPLKSLFDRPTVADLARQIDDLRRQGHRAAPAPVVIARGGDLPLTPMQEQMWTLAQMAPDSPAYNLSVLVSIDGAVAPDSLRQAFADTVARHESLRCRIVSRRGRPVLAEVGMVAVPLTVTDAPETAVAALARDMARHPFDLARDMPVRLALIRHGDAAATLIVTSHNVVMDGTAMGVFLADLWQAHAARQAGRVPDLAPLPLQPADFAAHLRAAAATGRAAHIAWWRDHLAGAPPLIDLPCDHARDPAAPGAGGVVTDRLDAAAATAVRDLARHLGTTLFPVLSAGLTLALNAWSGQSDLVVGTLVDTRSHPAAERVIANFMAFLPLRSRIDPDSPIRTLVASIRDGLLGAHAHRDLPFDAIVSAINPPRLPGVNPLYNIAFMFQAVPPLAIADGPDVQVRALSNGTSKLDLRVSIFDHGDHLDIEYEYADGLFDPGTIAAFAADCRRILARMAADPDVLPADLPAVALPAGLGARTGDTGTAGRAGDQPSLDALFDELDALSDDDARELIRGS